MWQACETGGPQVVDDFACSASSGIPAGALAFSDENTIAAQSRSLAFCDTRSSSLRRHPYAGQRCTALHTRKRKEREN